MNYADPNVRSALAGEYVLGTLHGGARRRFEQLMREDAQLRAEVERCQEDVYRLLDLLPDEAPPPEVWSRIDRRITQSLRESPVKPKARWWCNIVLWRSWALATTVAALLLALWVNLTDRTALDPSPNFVVVVTDDANSQPSWLISGRAGATSVRVRTLTPQPLPRERAFQLWMLPQGESRVRSVGLIPPSGSRVLQVSQTDAERLANAQKFGVSIEAQNGSPTGQPTTTPLYHGTPEPL